MALTTITAKDFMTTEIVTLAPDMEVLDAMHLLSDNRISGAPVVDTQGNIVGMLTERDCLRTVVIASYHGECCSGSVAGFMSQDISSVDADTSLMDLAELFVKGKYRSYPVLKDGRLLGVISRQDVIRAILELA